MACVTTTTTKACEQGTFVVTMAFTDEDGTAVIPNNISWSLYDQDDAIVNSRTSVAIAVPAASTTVVLKGDDLALPTPLENRRKMLVEWDYDSSLGTGLPAKNEYNFYIQNLVEVS